MPIYETPDFFFAACPADSGDSLACLLLFASCGGDDSSDDLMPPSNPPFTFDETESPTMRFVMANGAWCRFILGTRFGQL